MDNGMHDPDDPEGHVRRFDLDAMVGVAMTPADAQRAKRKRRRQALSCTGDFFFITALESGGRLMSILECKRRKIRCDRQNPCAPCIRVCHHLSLP